MLRLHRYTTSLTTTRVRFASKSSSEIDQIIRVDHAGELGADRIYAGQMAVLNRFREQVVLIISSNLRVGDELMMRTTYSRNRSTIMTSQSSVAPQIQHMWDQEKEHKAKFEELIRKYRVRPTALLPFWNVAGFMLGAGTALLGPKAAMACTVAVESVIVDHYNDQLRALMTDPETNKELLDIIQKFRDDEQDHHDAGIDHGAEEAPFYTALSEIIKVGCKIAIQISKVV